MLTELGGKGGSLCELARRGELKCPLMVRATSEDVVTGNIFTCLQAINPRWWLPDLLNTALGCNRFSTQIYRRFTIDLWRKQPTFPAYLLPWEEGKTEVDVEISWENPPTTVFIEMKYGSPLSATTVNNNGHNGHASDQLVRNIRIGLYKCGWYAQNLLFEQAVRDLVVILFAPEIGNTLAAKYRDHSHVIRALPNPSDLRGLPAVPFVGEFSYGELSKILKANTRFMSAAERMLVRLLLDYLELKLHQFRQSKQ